MTVRGGTAGSQPMKDPSCQARVFQPVPYPRRKICGTPQDRRADAPEVGPKSCPGRRLLHFDIVPSTVLGSRALSVRTSDALLLRVRPNPRPDRREVEFPACCPLDSRLLLPTRGRCLMICYPSLSTRRATEAGATEFGKQTRADRGNRGAISRRRTAGKEERS